MAGWVSDPWPPKGRWFNMRGTSRGRRRKETALAVALASSVVSSSVAASSAVSSSAVSSSVAAADLREVAPAGGGLPALDVRVDLEHGVVFANDISIPIGLDEAQLPSPSAVTVESVAIGQGKHVVHVRVPAKGQPPEAAAWEAILAGGRAQPIFAGITGLVSGDVGERTGRAIQIVPDGDIRYVLVGEVREDLRICGQGSTLLEPRALYPSSLELRPATVQRLDPSRMASAESIEAKATGVAFHASLARLLVARGSSVPGSRGLELTDGDPRTVWREMRPGIGQGEFVVMAAPKEVPIRRLDVILSPSDATPASNGAAPKTFYLATETRTIRVTVPEDAWRKPGEAYEVELNKPIEDSCVALVLDDAYTRGLAHPDVGVAELVGASDFDAPGTALDDVASLLSTPRGSAAAQVLERAGEGALAAVSKAYESLDARGRALAIDVAASAPRCEDAAPLLARAVCEKSGEAPRKAREKLERCSGAAPALAARLRDDALSRACLAPLLASIFPAQALEPIADAIAATPEADGETRAALRGALAEALPDPPAERLSALVADRARGPLARLEIVRAAGGRVAEAGAPIDALVGELMSGAPALRVRYLVLDPLGVLARAGDAAALRRVADAITRDAAWPVRARAADVASGLAALEAPLIAAVADPEPRVREAALASLADASSGQARSAIASDAARAAIDRLAHDGWWFVRARAAKLLSWAPARSDVDDALGGALDDSSARVRGSVVLALAHRRATSWREAIRKRLDDVHEDHDVRAEAATALGNLCDAESAERLTRLARKLAASDADPETQQIGLGALVGLAALHPRDLPSRLAPLLAAGSPPFVQAGAKRALAARPACP